MGWAMAESAEPPVNANVRFAALPAREQTVRSRPVTPALRPTRSSNRCVRRPGSGHSATPLSYTNKFDLTVTDTLVLPKGTRDERIANNSLATGSAVGGQRA